MKKCRRCGVLVEGEASNCTLCGAHVEDLAVNKTISWSVHVMFGLALPWICLARPLLLKFNVRKCLSWGFIGAIVLLFYLNGVINKFSEPWAFWLGAPIALLVWQTALEILCMAHKAERAEYEMSLTKLCVFSLVSSATGAGTCARGAEL